MKELKFYNEIHKYKKKERIQVYKEVKQLIKDYYELCDVVYKVLEKEINRDKVAQILSQLLPNKKINNYNIENCIDISYLNGVVYTISFNGEIELLTNIEYLDTSGFIWSMDLEEYKELERELKIFIGEK